MKLRYRLARLLGRQGWLRLGLRRRIVRRLADPQSVAPTGFDTSHFAGRYRGDIANVQEWCVYFFGGYELKELALITRLLSALRDPVALDIGGNLGGHALTMAQVAKTVHVVEPFPPLAERIEQLLALNAKHNVSVHRVGLGAEQAELAYYLETESRNQGTGSFLPDHTEGGEVAKLPVVRGDDYFAAVLEALDFVKIDVEGFEAPALAGLRQTLSRFEPFILMEVTESSARLWERFGGLESVLPFEFTIWRVCNPRYPLGVFQAYSYSITPVETVPAEKASYNVLIVPASRADDFKRLRKARRGPG